MYIDQVASSDYYQPPREHKEKKSKTFFFLKESLAQLRK